ncbi:MAG: NlpC/P60 family protein, partial [Agathobaculum sp.]|nr:NlpC/P60 family protein [Agathobaculum sp.]
SGFTSYVYKNTVCSIERVAQAQFDTTTRVSRDELLPGDLVFFGSSAYSISHVGIYVGDGQFIHAPHTGDVVKYDSLSGPYATRFQGGGRVIFD